MQESNPFVWKHLPAPPGAATSCKQEHQDNMPTTISESGYYSRVTAPWSSLFHGWPFPELANPHALGAKVVGSAYELCSLTYRLSTMTWVRRAEFCCPGWLNSHLFFLTQAILWWQEKPCGCIWTLLPTPDRCRNSRIHSTGRSFLSPAWSRRRMILPMSGEKRVFSEGLRRSLSPWEVWALFSTPTQRQTLLRRPQFPSTVASACKSFPS